MPDPEVADRLELELHRVAYLRSEGGNAALRRDAEVARPGLFAKGRRPIPIGFGLEWSEARRQSDLMEKYRVADVTIRRWRTDACLPMRSPGPNIKVPDGFVAAYESGAPLAYFLRVFGMSPDTVYRKARRLGLSVEGRYAARLKRVVLRRRARERRRKLAKQMEVSPVVPEGSEAHSPPADRLPVAPVAPRSRKLCCAPRAKQQDEVGMNVPAALREVVLATGGRYAGLADVAADQGLTLARVQQIWHAARGASA
ncbi:hypothetical protein [Marinibacterium sp. SX1]|uniref:hypothetical protein n=1 Tax=Marinibacterium sp. SX1 TaxID=3388424 RepID=UPI003D162E48